MTELQRGELAPDSHLLLVTRLVWTTPVKSRVRIHLFDLPWHV